ncbi:hypothetical protein SGRIM128S_09666 [Streptomyces griseomycini]
MNSSRRLSPQEIADRWAPGSAVRAGEAGDRPAQADEELGVDRQNSRRFESLFGSLGGQGSPSRGCEGACGT